MLLNLFQLQEKFDNLSEIDRAIKFGISKPLCTLDASFEKDMSVAIHCFYDLFGWLGG